MQLRTLLLAAAGVSGLSCGQAWADQSGPGVVVEGVIVTADPLRRSGGEVTSNVAVVAGEELAHRRQSTLGETLSGVPGVNSDTFGAGPAGR